MSNYRGDYAAGKTVFVPFDTFDAAGGSVTLTGLAVTDIEVYKNASMTQRASDNGYALLDTDGIDLDGLTGIHGFSIDLSDNSDAGFYAAGNDYFVVVSTVTIDGQTVSFVAAEFSIENRTNIGVNTKLDAIAAYIDTEIGDIRDRLPAALVSGRMDSSVGAVADAVLTAAKFASGAFDAVWSVAARLLTAGTNIILPTDAITAAALSTAGVNKIRDAIVAEVFSLEEIADEVEARFVAQLDAVIPATVPADGTRPSIRQSVYMTTQFLLERVVAGTAVTVKNPDGSTLLILTTNHAVTPTSITRST